MPVVCIVTPGTRDANNGNWRTAARWARMLRGRYRIIVQTQWDGTPCDALIALHARRSAISIQRYRDSAPDRPIALVLTGTDLYRDVAQGGEAARSLDIADRLIVLQDDAQGLLAPRWRRKSEVIFQSARALAHRSRHQGRLECIAVGHLREEKDPMTILDAVRALPREAAVRVRHIGAPLDARLAEAARDLARRDDRYRYLGALPHGLTRAALASADVLLHASIMEGGANVIVEAVTSGTPVIASRISGNVGMLGSDYPGYFEVKDPGGLARLIEKALRDPRFLRALKKACARRKPLFRPQAERRAVRRMTGALLALPAG